MLDWPEFMQRAILIAQGGLAVGEPPFGALVLDPAGNVIAEASDQVQTFRDLTRHAEIEAIRLAAAARGPDLTGCSLVTTVEPCPMCFTAAWLSRIGRVVYGTSMAAVAAATRGAQRELIVTAKWMNGASGSEIEVIDGVADRECLELFSPGNSCYRPRS
jgi:tRNA(adenine34) deaminase